jgi:predicted esterase
MSARRPDPPKTAARAGWLGRIPFEPETVRKVLLAAAILAIPGYFWWDYLTGDWGPLGPSGSWRRPRSEALTEADYRRSGFTFPVHKLANGAEAKYALYLPPSYAKDSSRVYPLVVFLHGFGERGIDGVKPLKHGFSQVLLNHLPQLKQPELDCLAVFPQSLSGHWLPLQEDILVAAGVTDDVLRSYRVDPDRVYLTGISSGGTGVWEVATAHPEVWAALVPISSTPRLEQAPVLKRIPCWCFHGAKDKPEGVSLVREMVRELKSQGAAVWHSEIPKAGHNIWSVYGDMKLYRWMLSQRRGAKAIPPQTNASGIAKKGS